MGTNGAQTRSGAQLLTSAHAATCGTPFRAAQGRLHPLLRHAATDLSQNDERMKSYEDCANQRNLIDRGRSDARAAAAAIRHLAFPSSVFSPVRSAAPWKRRSSSSGARRKWRKCAAGRALRRTRSAYAALRRILATPVHGGSNLAIGQPRQSVLQASPVRLPREGEAAVIRPLGADFRVIARIRVDRWDALGSAARN